MIPLMASCFRDFHLMAGSYSGSGRSVNCSTFMLMPKAFNITHLQPVHAFLRSSDNPNNFGCAARKSASVIADFISYLSYGHISQVLFH